MRELVHDGGRPRAGAVAWRGCSLGAIRSSWPRSHDELYQATIYHGRRGLGVHALSAVDVALHDLAGKQLGRPVYQLLGGARREAISPYATIYAGRRSGERSARADGRHAGAASAALELGFRAVKMEVLFGATWPPTASSSTASARAGACSAATSR